MTEHPYQLRRIELQDFKSVAQASVELKPLTVVVGANSSGKSTLLQSILAVTQAVRGGTGTAEFPLNGEFVRLGTFEETRNFLASQNDTPMVIAFELVDSLGWSARNANRAEDDDDLGLTQLVWRAYIDSARSSAGISDNRSGFARLSSLQIEVGSIWPDSESEGTRVLSCDVSEFDQDSEALERLQVVGRRARHARAGARIISASGRVQDWQSGSSSTIDAVILSGGVPQSLLRRTSQFQRLAEVWWNIVLDVLGDTLQEQRRKVASRDTAAKVNRSAVMQASSDIQALDIPDVTAGVPALVATQGVETWSDVLERVLYRRLGQLSPKEREAVAESVVQLGEAEFRALLRGELDDQPWIDDDVLVEQSGPAGEALWRCGFISQRFFRSFVRYLGPLREAPHVLYDPGPSKLDLGVRGEYAAAVLHAQARTSVLMPTPDGNGETRLLSDALNFWLREFGLAEQAESEDRGRIGIGLSVTPKGISRAVDLTSVGVGVSQVLPVILLCLLAEPGALVVLEQPELHLHPKLQQDLADFLLACARSGRQLVIETHSDHLVNRLRYRIAEDDSDETHDLIGLVFAEMESGITSYREPEINSYGGLGEDWPAGFLELTTRQSQELVKQSLAKRKRDAALDSDS